MQALEGERWGQGNQGLSWSLAGRGDKGLFITTGYFSGQASDEATRDGAIAIDLIDGHRLCDLLKEKHLGVETEMVEMVHVLSDWFKGI